MPPADIQIKIEREESGRRLTLCAASVPGKAVIARLQAVS